MEDPQHSAVTPFELAVLVLHYLEAQRFKKTAQSLRRYEGGGLHAWQGRREGARRSPAASRARRQARACAARARREARLILGDAATALPAGVKNLGELLNEYVAVRERDARRQALAASSAVAQSLYSLLDFHAGLPAPQTLPPIFYTQPVVAQGAQQPTQQQQQRAAAGGGPPPMIPVQAADLSYPTQPAQHHGEAAAAAAAGQQTPGRHAHRKGAPRKRRKLEDGVDLHAGSAAGGAGGLEFGGGGGEQLAGPGAAEVAAAVAAAGAGGGSGGSGGAFGLDLLNMPLDEEGLLSLLCDDDLQVRGGRASPPAAPLLYRRTGVALPAVRALCAAAGGAAKTGCVALPRRRGMS